MVVMTEAKKGTGEDLELETPYWDDVRVSFLYSSLKRGALDLLIDTVKDDSTWTLLMTKMEKQDGFVAERVKTYYELWKQKKPIVRCAIRKHGKS